MSAEEAIQALKALDGKDYEADHESADCILLELLKSNGFEGVALAFDQARQRIDFGYA
jgi:hypothetical protein